MRVLLDREPLRYTFVSHRPDFGDPVIALTDADGNATFRGLRSTASIDVVVHAQNLAVRMLDGAHPGVSEIALRFRNKTDGSTLNISPANKKQFPAYQVMDACYRSYETVFSHIPPFSNSTRRTYPFGGHDKPAHELRSKPPVDCRFPESLIPGKLPWVQPQSVTSGVPLMHLKSPRTDKRLFGSARRPATTIPHEYAHAMHFALLPKLKRWELAAKYALWIGNELANGRSGTHRTDKRTSPLIAYVESIGIFAQRFELFATEIRPELSGAALRAAFVEDELSPTPGLADVLPGYRRVADYKAGRVRPLLTGQSVEGAVYGAIFLDLAHRVDLVSAVNWYLRSRAFDARNHLEFVSRQRKGSMTGHATAVGTTWKISPRRTVR